jgi:3-oxoacyl-[acyl-carrier protein] reductase
MQINDKVVAVTGGARGIGKAIAGAFVERGARVALIDLSPADLEAARSEFAGNGAKVSTYAANVAREDQVVAALDGIVADLGRLDVLVNNAGIIKDGLLVKAKDGVVTGKMGLEQWQAVIDVNLTGVFLCAREAAEKMITGGNPGVIVNISSISRSGNAGQTNYSAAKAGVEAMAVVWAKELARYGIRAASIAPGFINTEMVQAMKPEAREKIAAGIPAKRLGEPDEIAQTVEFIFQNDYVSGRCFEIDGGLRL